jgi:hypothetical protein
MLTSLCRHTCLTDSDCHGCQRDLNFPNRRMRTRTSGGVGGAQRGQTRCPLSRFGDLGPRLVMGQSPQTLMTSRSNRLCSHVSRTTLLRRCIAPPIGLTGLQASDQRSRPCESRGWESGAGERDPDLQILLNLSSSCSRRWWSSRFVAC